MTLPEILQRFAKLGQLGPFVRENGEQLRLNPVRIWEHQPNAYSMWGGVSMQYAADWLLDWALEWGKNMSHFSVVRTADEWRVEFWMPNNSYHPVRTASQIPLEALLLAVEASKKGGNNGK